ncbi:uncharacterized protein E0L32_002110 [Thyridium curvatum]|uniref:Clr5 domain-containing protein n=1 Tax=Thyridium curvatum TaxID=1093900 RepID=A0A507AT84_9PEZI|nr:uncharacterized protein E0L32_002023 [Thyridium curvatum]XP_030989218.1 uncharacterized protein E0L32_002110 [Thyridium curvatum]TPX07420.1 hypothetical protein E0L32_002023 [Thyridium curvatum]TPX07507.1 hypothetical protein E0L32_002110 [Thyridium curvatum]
MKLHSTSALLLLDIGGRSQTGSLSACKKRIRESTLNFFLPNSTLRAMAPKPASIPQEEWERHKQTIARLYRTSTLRSVISEMQREHGFQATPWQFEKQLKLWNIRKNTTRKEWENFFDPSQTPQNSIVQPSVTPAGHSKSMASIQRSQRYLRQLRKQDKLHVGSSQRPTLHSNTNTIQQKCDDGTNTNLETGLAELSTIISASSVDVSREPDSMSVSPYIIDTWEPSQNDHLGPDMDWVGQFSLNMSTPRLAPSPIYGPSLAMDSAFMQRQILTPENAPFARSPKYYHGMQVNWGSHFLEFEKFLLSKGVNFGPSANAILTRATESTRSGATVDLFTNFVTSRLERGTLQASKLSDTQQSFLRVISLLPGQGTAPGLVHQYSRTQLIRALLFSFLNGFAGLGELRGENIIELLGQLGALTPSLLKVLKEGPPHTTKIFLDSMLIAAINTKNRHLLEQLLESPRVNVNGIVIDLEGESLTPIERAAVYADLDIIRLLVEAGADVNATHRNYNHGGGALMRLLKAQQKDQAGAHHAGSVPMHTLFKVVEILRVAGAKIWPVHVKVASQLCDNAVANYIALNVTAAEHGLFFGDRHMKHLETLVEVLGEHHGLLAIQHLITTCERSNCNTCRFARGKWTFQRLARFAARRGYADLLQFLSGFIALSADTLCAAIKSGSRRTIDLVLSQNPTLDSRARYTEQYPITPLSCAVRAGNIDLIDLLHKAGALGRLEEGLRFGALIRAAAKWGDYGYLSMLLDRLDDWFNLDGVPIEVALAAARSGHKSIARLLLQYSPSRRSYRSDGDRSVENVSMLYFALQHQDIELVEFMVHDTIELVGKHHLNAAFEWGDYSVISSLFRLAYGDQYYRSFTCGSEQAWESLSISCMEDQDIATFHKIVNSSLERPPSLVGCFIKAVQAGHYDMVNYLLDIGESPYESDILAAIIQYHPSMLELVADKQRKRQYLRQCIGARVIQDVMAATGNDPSAQSRALNTLLGTGVVNLVVPETIPVGSNFMCLTPLGLAIVRLSQKVDGSLWMVEALLSAGADPNSFAYQESSPFQPPKQFTGLLLGIQAGEKALVQALLDRGANVNQEPHLSISKAPLQYAAELGDIEMVRLLLRRGADANGRPAARGGGTALQFACVAGNCNIAAMLLEDGADLGARPSQIHGRWPLEAAAEHGRLEMIQLLWDAKEQTIGEVEGFQRRQCLKAMAFAHQSGHMACRDLVSELSGIPIEALDSERVGAQWLAFIDLEREAFEQAWPSAVGELRFKPHRTGILSGRRPQSWWSGIDRHNWDKYFSGRDDDSSSEDEDSFSEDEDFFRDDHEFSSDVDDYGGSSD